MDTLAIIKRIEMRLVEIGMSKADFYKQSGISSASFSQWNTGRYNPSKKKLELAASCLNLSYEYLVNGTTVENVPDENSALYKEKAPAENGERSMSDSELKFALFGDCDDVTDDDLADVRRYAAFVLERKKDLKK